MASPQDIFSVEFDRMSDKEKLDLGLMGIVRMYEQDQLGGRMGSGRRSSSISGIGGSSAHQGESYIKDVDDTVWNDLVGLMARRTYNVRLSNAFSDIIEPLERSQDLMLIKQQMFDSRMHHEHFLYYRSILSTLSVQDSANRASFIEATMLQYRNFMRHPIWNTMRVLTDTVVRPLMRATMGVLFGFGDRRSDTQKIVDAIKEQTKFLRTGEINQGRSFFQRLAHSGVLGTSYQIVAEAAVEAITGGAVSRNTAQENEIARSEGREQGKSFADSLSKTLFGGSINLHGQNVSEKNDNLDTIVKQLKDIREMMHPSFSRSGVILESTQVQGIADGSIQYLGPNSSMSRSFEQMSESLTSIDENTEVTNARLRRAMGRRMLGGITPTLLFGLAGVSASIWALYKLFQGTTGVLDGIASILGVNRKPTQDPTANMTDGQKLQYEIATGTGKYAGMGLGAAAGAKVGGMIAGPLGAVGGAIVGGFAGSETGQMVGSAVQRSLDTPMDAASIDKYIAARESDRDRLSKNHPRRRIIQQEIDALKARKERIESGDMSPLSGSSPDAARPILDLVAQHESRGGSYNSLVYGKQGARTPKKTDLTDMTIAEVMEYQKGMVGRGHASTAVGRYQFINATLKDSVRALGLSLNTKFTPEVQDKLATYLLKRRGLDQFLSGAMDEQTFAANISQEWASLPANETGRSAYHGVGQNRAGVDYGTVIETLRGARNQGIELDQEQMIPNIDTSAIGEVGKSDAGESNENNLVARQLEKVQGILINIHGAISESNPFSGTAPDANTTSLSYGD